MDWIRKGVVFSFCELEGGCWEKYQYRYRLLVLSTRLSGNRVPPRGANNTDGFPSNLDTHYKNNRKGPTHISVNSFTFLHNYKLQNK
jgi:hypothetical protein